jgi:hypothetical protein
MFITGLKSFSVYRYYRYFSIPQRRINLVLNFDTGTGTLNRTRIKNRLLTAVPPPSIYTVPVSVRHQHQFPEPV